MAGETDASIGKIVKKIRTQLGLNQQDLAERSGFNNKQTISEIENGRRALKATEVHSLAQALHVEYTELLLGKIPSQQPVVLWREPIDGNHRRTEEAVFLQRCRRYSFLEEILNARAKTQLPQRELNLKDHRFEDVEEWAEGVRDALGLGEAPGAALREALENVCGVKIFRAGLKAGSAATARGDFGNAIVQSANQPPGRRSFNLAHELFHLITWDSITSGAELDSAAASRNEQLANVFASALLLPEGPIRRAITRLHPHAARFIDLIPVARSFSVSLPALLWRLVTLQMLDADTVRGYLDSGTRWARTDPGWVAENEDRPELPERYALLAFRAWVQGEISIGKLAQLMETTAGMLDYELSRYGLELDTDAYQAEVLSA